MATRRRQDSQDQFGTWRKGLGTPQIKLSRSQGAPKVGPDEKDSQDTRQTGNIPSGPPSYKEAFEKFGAGINEEARQTSLMDNIAAGAAGLPPAQVNKLGFPGMPVFGEDKDKDGKITGGEIAAPYQYGRVKGALGGMRLGGLMGQKYSSPAAQLGAVLGGLIRGIVDPESVAKADYEQDLAKFYARTEAESKVLKAQAEVERVNAINAYRTVQTRNLTIRNTTLQSENELEEFYTATGSTLRSFSENPNPEVRAMAAEDLRANLVKWYRHNGRSEKSVRYAAEIMPLEEVVFELRNTIFRPGTQTKEYNFLHYKENLAGEPVLVKDANGNTLVNSEGMLDFVKKQVDEGTKQKIQLGERARLDAWTAAQTTVGKMFGGTLPTDKNGNYNPFVARLLSAEYTANLAIANNPDFEVMMPLRNGGFRKIKARDYRQEFNKEFGTKQEEKSQTPVTVSVAPPAVSGGSATSTDQAGTVLTIGQQAPQKFVPSPMNQPTKESLALDNTGIFTTDGKVDLNKTNAFLTALENFNKTPDNTNLSQVVQRTDAVVSALRNVLPSRIQAGSYSTKFDTGVPSDSNYLQMTASSFDVLRDGRLKVYYGADSDVMIDAETPEAAVDAANRLREQLNFTKPGQSFRDPLSAIRSLKDGKQIELRAGSENSSIGLLTPSIVVQKVDGKFRVFLNGVALTLNSGWQTNIKPPATR